MFGLDPGFSIQNKPNHAVIGDNYKLGTRVAAAKQVHQDVVGRSVMAQTMITDTTEKTAIMAGSSEPPVGFGNDAKEKVRSLNSV